MWKLDNMIAFLLVKSINRMKEEKEQVEVAWKSGPR